MKKYLLFLLSLFLIACGGQEETENYKQQADELGRSLQELKLENNLLKNQILELEKLNTIILEEGSALANKLEAEVKNLRDASSQSESTRIRNLEREVANLNRENKNLKDNVERLEARNKHMNDENRNLKDNIARLEGTNKRISDENQKLKDQAIRLERAEKELEKIIEENRAFFRNNPNVSPEQRRELDRIERKAQSAFDELDAELEKLGW